MMTKHPPSPFFPKQGFIGISGAYDLAGDADYFHQRGLYRSVLSSIMCHDLSLYSPTRRVGLAGFDPKLATPVHSLLPPVTLFHGTADARSVWRKEKN